VLDIGNELIEKVRAAASVSTVQVPASPLVVPVAPAPLGPARLKSVDVVVIGISTGGPQALRLLIPSLPVDFPVPVAIVLHMPLGYTEEYARRLDEASRLMVREAREGERLAPGVVLLARAGQHLTFRREPDGSVVAHLDFHPADTPHRPSVDVLFQSAAAVFGERVLGIVMTGMGSDGQQGAAWIKAQGGTIWTESEASCVVYGMPRSVVEAMLSDRSLALNDIAPALAEVV
jgi:two-component system chemotaxis response regulator CheB